MENVLTTVNLFWPLLGILGALILLIWNSLRDRINEIEKIQRSRPFPQIQEDIAEIKNDIRWIKQILNNNQK